MSFRETFSQLYKLSPELYSTRKLSEEEFCDLQLSENKINGWNGEKLPYAEYARLRDITELCVEEHRSMTKNPHVAFSSRPTEFWSVQNIGVKKAEDFNFEEESADDDADDLIPRFVKVALDRGRFNIAMALINENLDNFHTAKNLLRVLHLHFDNNILEVDRVVAMGEYVLPKVVRMQCFRGVRSELGTHFGSVCFLAMSKVVGECFVDAVLGAGLTAAMIKNITKTPMNAVGATALLPIWTARTQHHFFFTVQTSKNPHSNEQICAFANALKEALHARRLAPGHNIFKDTDTLVAVFSRWKDADVRAYMNLMDQKSINKLGFGANVLDTFVAIKARCFHSEYFDYAFPLIQNDLPPYCCVWIVEYLVSEREYAHYKAVSLVQHIWNFRQKKLRGELSVVKKRHLQNEVLALTTRKK